MDDENILPILWIKNMGFILPENDSWIIPDRIIGVPGGGECVCVWGGGGGGGLGVL